MKIFIQIVPKSYPTYLHAHWAQIDPKILFFVKQHPIIVADAVFPVSCVLCLLQPTLASFHCLGLETVGSQDLIRPKSFI